MGLGVKFFLFGIFEEYDAWTRREKAWVSPNS